MIKIRAAVILTRNGRILLAEHEKGGKKYWVVPGGKVEKGESLEEAAAREIEEETGLKTRIEKLVFVSEVLDGRKHIIDFFFKGSIISGRLRKGPDRNLSRISFIPFGSLDEIEFYPRIKPELKLELKDNFSRAGRYLRTGRRAGRKGG